VSAGDVVEQAAPFLRQCGTCDAGVRGPCTCNLADYRPTMLALVREVERLRPLVGDARTGYDQAVAVLAAVAQRTGSPAAGWAANYLRVDPDRLAPPLMTPRGDHPYTDPGDGRTECGPCGKYVWPATHSCKRVPVTPAAQLRAQAAARADETSP
jgi:hypothetical protein